MNYVKLIDNTLEYAETTKLIQQDGNFLRVDKTEQEILADGFKPLLDGTVSTDGDYQVVEYREEVEAIYKDVVAKFYTDEEKAQQEQARKDYIANLTMTKREFCLVLEAFSAKTYTDILELVSGSPQAKMEWDCCTVLQRNNVLLDATSAGLGVTPQQLDEMFIYVDNQKRGGL